MAQNVKIVTQSSDVGELLKLLPSDIFPMDQEFVFEPKHSSSGSNSSAQNHQLSCMAENRLLAQSCGTISVIEPTPNSSNQRIYEWVRYDVPCIPLGSSPPPPGVVPLWCLVRDGSTGGIHGVFDPRTGSFVPVLIPVYTCPIFVPVQTSVGNLGGGGGGGGEGGEGAGVVALQSQQNSQVSNRLLPLPGGKAGNRGGSVRGNGGGTGVFLPRKTANISSTAANNNTAVARKRQGARNRLKAQLFPKKNSTSPADNKKQEDCLSLPPSEINLPTEWTY